MSWNNQYKTMNNRLALKYNRIYNSLDYLYVGCIKYLQIVYTSQYMVLTYKTAFKHDISKRSYTFNWLPVLFLKNVTVTSFVERYNLSLTDANRIKYYRYPVGSWLTLILFYFFVINMFKIESRVTFYPLYIFKVKY